MDMNEVLSQLSDVVSKKLTNAAQLLPLRGASDEDGFNQLVEWLISNAAGENNYLVMNHRNITELWGEICHSKDILHFLASCTMGLRLHVSQWSMVAENVVNALSGNISPKLDVDANAYLNADSFRERELLLSNPILIVVILLSQIDVAAIYQNLKVVDIIPSKGVASNVPN